MLESGIKNTGLDNLIKTGYNTLGLSTFFTSGPEESRAWTIEKNSKAADAAGVIHTDFKKKFIRAETVTHEDFIKYKGFNECKNAGKLRLEGKDYLVNDGDVMYLEWEVKLFKSLRIFSFIFSHNSFNFIKSFFFWFFL